MPKSYKTGDVIATCEPLTHTLNREFKGKYCDFCFAKMSTNAIKQCSQCKFMFYCDADCQQNDWRCHKLECDIYSKFDFTNINFNDYWETDMCTMLDNDSLIRLLMRTWLLIKAEPATLFQEFECTTGKMRCLNDFMSHMDDIKKDAKRMILFDKFCNKFCEFGIEVNREEFGRLLGQIAVNFYECKIYDITNVPQYVNTFVGWGMYVPITIYNHSCQPNAVYLNFGHKVQIKALKDIAENEEIFIDYIPMERTGAERRAILKNYWYFDCMCPRCDTNSDYGVDYKMLSFLWDHSNKSNVNITEQQLDVLEQIYTKYHPAYGFYSTASLAAKKGIVDENNNVSDGNDKKMIINTYMSLKTAYGFDHELLKEFESLVWNKLNVSKFDCVEG